MNSVQMLSSTELRKILKKAVPGIGQSGRLLSLSHEELDLGTHVHKPQKNECWYLEQAMETELHVLHTPLSEELKNQVALWFNSRQSHQILVGVDGNCSFGFEPVCGQAGLERSLIEARAASEFTRRAGGSSSGVLLIDMGDYHSSQDLIEIFKQQGLPVNVLPDFAAEDSPPAADSASRVILARLYNRLYLPENHREFAHVLAGTSQPGEFSEDAELRYGEQAKKLFDQARSHFDQIHNTSLHSEVDKSDKNPGETEVNQVEDRRLFIRQVRGRSGAPGRVSGRLSFNRYMSDSSILICERYVRSGEEPEPMLALVERDGCCFGDGAIIAHKLGIPHIYQLEDFSHLSEGMPVHVDGNLGILTASSQG